MTQTGENDELRAQVRTYRMSRVLPTVGVVGIVFIVYVALSEWYGLPWIFAERDASTLVGVQGVVFAGFFGPGGLLLIRCGRARATITAQGLRYRGLFRVRFFAWADISDTELHRRPFEFRIYAEGRWVTLLALRGSDGELSDAVASYVAKHSARATVDEGPNELGSQKLDRD